MAQVTLIGQNIAEKDLVFRYLGPLSECKDCKLKNICFNLKPYYRYRIKKVRDKRHSCSVHDGDVVVVEVERLPLLAAIEKKYSKGSKITYQSRKCDQSDCDWYGICQSNAVKDNRKYKILKINDSIDCQQGFDLQEVELKE